MQEIIRLDKALFNVLNGQWTNSFFDFLFPYLRNGNLWMPFYLFFIVFVTVNFRRNGWWWVFTAVVTVATSDFLNSIVLRDWLLEWTYRARPCRDLNLVGDLRFLVQYCPDSSSFMSSHATNHFAIAFFIYSTLKNYTGKWLAFLFVWAFLIVYAQVYVGVHFPLDVICGALFGTMIGYGGAKFSNHFFPLAAGSHSKFSH
jgi:membrane-associated phospholipid phosphatase